MSRPIVSVIITTYNHEGYIADALRGAVGQITEFPFEIIVHDDASTDGTQEIIRQYAARFPNLIVPILQSQNQYALGTKIFSSLLRQMARGDYIATCEGDDYWIDPYKLQKQFDFLEKNPRFSGCLHNAIVVDYVNDLTYLSELNDGDREKPFATIVREGGGLINPTASLFYRSSINDSIYVDWNAPVGDHFRMMSIGLAGPFWWLSDPMSVYRYGSLTSYTRRNRSFDLSAVDDYANRYVSSLEKMRSCSGGLAEDAFHERVGYERKACSDRKKVLRFLNSEKTNLSILRGLPTINCLDAIAGRILRQRDYDKLRHLSQLILKKKSGTLVSQHASCPKALGDSEKL